MTKRESRPGGTETAIQTHHHHAEQVHSQYIANDYRRRAAAERSEPQEWSGFRDPLFDPTRPSLTIDSYELAAQHLLGEGLCPHPDRAALEALWRRQGHSRSLAQAVVDRWGGEVA